MTFVYRAVKKDDADYQKYVDLEQRYMEETPKDILKKHNYLYDIVGENHYKENLSICSRSETDVVIDDERDIYLVLMHYEDCRSGYYSTPMAWVLFFDDQMILINSECDNNMGLLDNGEKWYNYRYLIEPLVLPELIKNREKEIKQYIMEALTAYSESGLVGGTLPIFTIRDTE